jgi:hypothetical protein
MKCTCGAPTNHEKCEKCLAQPMRQVIAYWGKMSYEEVDKKIKELKKL